MLLLLLLGCPTRVTAHCESTDRAISDREVLDFGASVSDLLATIGPARVEAMDLTGDAVLLDVEIARAEGDAQLADGEVVEEITRRGTPRRRRVTWEGDNALCDDVVSVPVELSVLGDGRHVSVIGPATLTSREIGGIRYSEADYVLSPEDVLPDGLHGARTGGRLRVTWADGTLAEVRGEVDAEDGTAELVLWYGGAH